MNRCSTLVRRALVLGGAVALALASARLLSQVKKGEEASATRSNFVFMIFNQTDHQIHLRLVDRGDELIDIVVPPRPANWRFLADGRPNPEWAFRAEIGASIRDDARAIDVEELQYLKVRRTFKVAGFTQKSDADFRLVVTDHGLSLTQDFLLPIVEAEQEKLRERDRDSFLRERARERKLAGAGEFCVINESGRPITVRLLIDGSEVFRTSLPGQVDPTRSRMPVPVARETIRVSGNAKELTVEETQALKRVQTFSLRAWLQQGGAVLIHVRPSRIDLSYGPLPQD